VRKLLLREGLRIKERGSEGGEKDTDSVGKGLAQTNNIDSHMKRAEGEGSSQDTLIESKLCSNIIPLTRRWLHW
jgi:hypothetical protein